MASILAGCTDRSAPPVAARSASWVGPIRPSCKDVATEALQRQVVTHNAMWAKQNGVPLPPKKPDYCNPKKPQDKTS